MHNLECEVPLILVLNPTANACAKYVIKRQSDAAPKNQSSGVGGGLVKTCYMTGTAIPG